MNLADAEPRRIAIHWPLWDSEMHMVSKLDGSPTTLSDVVRSSVPDASDTTVRAFVMSMCAVGLAVEGVGRARRLLGELGRRT